MVNTTPTQVYQPKIDKLSPCIILLGASLGSLFDGLEVTCAHIEPHGAILLTRLRSGEIAEQFAMSAAEIDRLISFNRKRKALIKRFHEARAQARTDTEEDDESPYHDGIPVDPLDDNEIPF